MAYNVKVEAEIQGIRFGAGNYTIAIIDKKGNLRYPSELGQTKINETTKVQQT